MMHFLQTRIYIINEMKRIIKKRRLFYIFLFQDNNIHISRLVVFPNEYLIAGLFEMHLIQRVFINCGVNNGETKNFLQNISIPSIR